MNDQQKTFGDIAELLDARARELLNMPNYGQVDENLVNMANFFPLIQPLIDAVEPSSICEIGSDQGMTTKLLRQYCRDNNCVLHSVDPCFTKSEQVDERTSLHKCLSFDYLASNEPSQVYFVDGDHNYYTVAKELELIRERNLPDQPCVVFLHDVGWPCGRIDMYYQKENIPEEQQKNTIDNPLISLLARPNRTDDQGYPMNGMSVALEDKSKAGIATAIEDFLATSEGWEYVSIPSVFGLGILVYSGVNSTRLTEEFDNIRQIFNRFSPFLSILEFNRITLLEKINQSGLLWLKQQDVIEQYSEQIDLQQLDLNTVREQVQEQENIRAANEQMLKDMETFTGWVKYRFRRFRK